MFLRGKKEEEKENISIKAKGRELLETLDNLVTDSANDIINKPNHYQLQRKVRKAHSFRCGMDSMFLTFN